MNKREYRYLQSLRSWLRPKDLPIQSRDRNGRRVHSNRSHRNILPARSQYLLLLLLVLPGIGCRRDMQSQPKYTPLSRSWFYPDGRSARPIPPGTIPVDEVNIDPAVETGKANGDWVNSIPIPVTSDLLARGRERYNIYCAPCHGRTGFGNGTIAERGFKKPANLNGKRVRGAPPGYLYQVIVNGYGGMGPYAYQIKSPRDRWAIVAYIRALELSRYTPLADAPASARSRLEAEP